MLLIQTAKLGVGGDAKISFILILKSAFFIPGKNIYFFEKALILLLYEFMLPSEIDPNLANNSSKT